MTRIVWSTSVGGIPRVDNKRSVPKKPAVWWGDVWLLMPDGARHIRQWRSQTRIQRNEAQLILAAMLDDLVSECGENAAVDSGFRLECR